MADRMDLHSWTAVLAAIIVQLLLTSGALAESEVDGGKGVCVVPKVIQPTTTVLLASSDCPAVGFVKGRSRLLNLHRVFHVVNITVEAPPGVPATACLHQNMSAERGATCPSSLLSVPRLKGSSSLWSEKHSPFQSAILELTTKSTSEINFVVTIKEVFEPQRVACVLGGLLLFYIAPAASKSLFLYYGSFMGLGVVLVTLVLLFQSMKLMPFGGKTAKVIFSGVVLGLGSVVKQNATRLAWRLLHVLGVGQPGDPILRVVFVLFAVAGAGLGFWVLRKFVLNDRGRPDDATQVFVEWGCLRLPALVLLIQASYDYVFSVLILIAALLPLVASPVALLLQKQSLNLDSRADGSLRPLTVKDVEPLADSKQRLARLIFEHYTEAATKPSTPSRKASRVRASESAGDLENSVLEARLLSAYQAIARDADFAVSLLNLKDFREGSLEISVEGLGDLMKELFPDKASADAKTKTVFERKAISKPEEIQRHWPELQGPSQHQQLILIRGLRLLMAPKGLSEEDSAWLLRITGRDSLTLTEDDLIEELTEEPKDRSAGTSNEGGPGSSLEETPAGSTYEVPEAVVTPPSAERPYYQVTVKVAGFGLEDLEVLIREDGVLIVTGTPDLDSRSMDLQQKDIRLEKRIATGVVDLEKSRKVQLKKGCLIIQIHLRETRELRADIVGSG